MARGYWFGERILLYSNQKIGEETVHIHEEYMNVISFASWVC